MQCVLGSRLQRRGLCHAEPGILRAPRDRRPNKGRWEVLITLPCALTPGLQAMNFEGSGPRRGHVTPWPMARR